MKKNILAMETSSPILSVALRKGGERIVESTSRNFMTHAEKLLPTVAKLLKKKKLGLDEIDEFWIGRGPGSFTGLRIGFATLKGFLVGEKKKCFGALSMDTVAQGVSLPDGSRLGVCLDARRETVYARFYTRTSGKWKPESLSAALSVREFIRSIETDVHLAGDALRKYRGEIENHSKGRKVHYLPETLWYPKASHLIALDPPIKSGDDKTFKQLIKPADFVPFYIRLSEPEEKRKAHAHTR